MLIQLEGAKCDIHLILDLLYGLEAMHESKRNFKANNAKTIYKIIYLFSLTSICLLIFISYYHLRLIFLLCIT